MRVARRLRRDEIGVQTSVGAWTVAAVSTSAEFRGSWYATRISGTRRGCGRICGLSTSDAMLHESCRRAAPTLGGPLA